MDFVNLLCSAWPENNFWANLIKLFDVGSYAWTIIIFTIVLKLVLSPVDFFQKFYTNKTSRMQAKLQPEIEKLKKRYGQNQALLYQKQNELYKKNNFGMRGSCVVMLVYMATTLVVFITLFNSLQYISGFKINNQFEELKSEYYNSYNQDYYTNYLDITVEEFNALDETAKTNKLKEKGLQIVNNTKLTIEVLNIETEYYQDYLGIDLTEYNALLEAEKPAFILEKEEAKALIESENVNKQAINNAQIVVVEKYGEIKDSWLWIKNIWRPDKALAKEIPTYAEFKNLKKDTAVVESEYNTVMGLLLNNYNNTNSVNGYYVLSILVVLVSFGSQWINKLLTSPKGKDGRRVTTNQPGFAKILMFILPFTMLLFTLNSSAVFAVYIIVNSAMSAAISPLTTIISNKIEDKNEKKRQESIRVDYRR